MAICEKKINVLKFDRPGESESHRHYKDHHLHVISGSPWFMEVYFEGPQGKKGELESRNGPFGPGDKYFVRKHLIHKAICQDPNGGLAQCEFENDGTPTCGMECYGNPG